ncbi:hypothetical protein [Elizabethkingia anophelis]|uniref:hypothetical protein n=1 Tax=Elizabethkingia anophelis TaxID=1117645 RepID=UPI0021A6B54E|nr:hypothetical protein [Elizabethkingia anophelis]
MRKKILFAPLWGIFALSLLSSCRTEDGAITQKQIEDKRFAVFVPKDGKPVNYANGFEFLMKRYDQINGTNMSGTNNPIKNNLNASSDKSSFLFQNRGSYVEFKVRSQIATEKNGEKWVVYPKVENNQVIGLIMSTLKEKETLIAFDEIKNNSEYYKQIQPLFQEALNRYNKKRISLALNASIKPMAIGGEGEEPGGGCGADVQQCGNIEEVVIPGKPNQPKEPPTKPVGVSSCDSISNCPPPTDSDGGGGGGGSNGNTSQPVADINVDELKNYPCAYAIAQELPNLKNELADALNKIFKNSKKYDLTFKVSKILTGASTVDGETKGPNDPANYQGNVFKQTIYLNKDVLTNATKEYILVTMYHEVVHAYLNAELNRLGEQQFKIEYPSLYFEDQHVMINGTQVDVKRFTYYKDHQEAATFINTLQNILKSYNPNISSETASVLSKAGMVDLTPNDQKVNDRERGINKNLGTPEGTKC